MFAKWIKQSLGFLFFSMVPKRGDDIFCVALISFIHSVSVVRVMRLIQKDLTAGYTVLGSMAARLPSVTQNQAPVDLKLRNHSTGTP